MQVKASERKPFTKRRRKYPQNRECIEKAAERLALMVSEAMCEEAMNQLSKSTLNRLEHALFRYNDLRAYGFYCDDVRCCKGRWPK